MIDFYDAIFSSAARALRAEFPGIRVTGEISDQVAKFPCVQIEESRNLPTQQDNTGHSHYAALQYRVRVYSNKESGKIKEARSIMSVIDSVFEPLNLRRKSYVVQNGLYNNSAYRIEATYETVVDENGVLYRR